MRYLTFANVLAAAALTACAISLWLHPLLNGMNRASIIVAVSLLWVPLAAAGGWALVRTSGWLTLLVALTGFALMLLPGAWLALIFEQSGISPLRLSMDHVLFYFGVSATHCFLATDRSRKFLLWTFAGFLLSGFCVEVIQRYVPGRHGDLIDVLADGIGLSLGMLAGTAVSRLWAAGRMQQS